MKSLIQVVLDSGLISFAISTITHSHFCYEGHTLNRSMTTEEKASIPDPHLSQPILASPKKDKGGAAFYLPEDVEE